jgi:hypothetical protein
LTTGGNGEYDAEDEDDGEGETDAEGMATLRMTPRMRTTVRVKPTLKAKATAKAKAKDSDLAWQTPDSGFLVRSYVPSRTIDTLLIRHTENGDVKIIRGLLTFRGVWRPPARTQQSPLDLLGRNDRLSRWVTADGLCTSTREGGDRGCQRDRQESVAGEWL